jgi:hypothetical protein
MVTSGRDINQSVMPTILRNLAVFRWCNGACGLARVGCGNLLVALVVSELDKMPRGYVKFVPMNHRRHKSLRMQR